MSPPRILLLAALLALGPLLAVVPTGGADHTFSHRFIFEGRLLGNNSLPIPGRAVEFWAIGDDFSEPCVEGHRAVTDEFGDFRFCFHKHDLSANATVGARSGGANLSKQMDTAFRKSVVTLEDPDAEGVAPEGWEKTHYVGGRAWRPGAQVVDGVPVYGNTVNHVQVNLTLRTTEGPGPRMQTTTDAYGDFHVDVRVPDDVPPGEVGIEVEILGKRETRVFDDRTHRLTIGMFLAPESASGPITIAGPTPPAYPGITTPEVDPRLFLAIGAGLALAIGFAWLGNRGK